MALSAEHGIVLQVVGDLTRVKAQLYAQRKEAGDPALEALSIRVFGQTLAIVKKSSFAQQTSTPQAPADA